MTHDLNVCVTGLLCINLVSIELMYFWTQIFNETFLNFRSQLVLYGKATLLSTFPTHDECYSH